MAGWPPCPASAPPAQPVQVVSALVRPGQPVVSSYTTFRGGVRHGRYHRDSALSSTYSHYTGTAGGRLLLGSPRRPPRRQTSLCALQRLCGQPRLLTLAEHQNFFIDSKLPPSLPLDERTTNNDSRCLACSRASATHSHGRRGLGKAALALLSQNRDADAVCVCHIVQAHSAPPIASRAGTAPRLIHGRIAPLLLSHRSP
eukprot:COSAG01_NODE_967_length_12384_cov_3.880505_4_plen_200_part_00